MTFGSLFAGIGGLDLGLERAGMECKWQVEIDPYCQKVLAKHWPNVKRYGDIREVQCNELEPVDLICGGFPCQDITSLRQGHKAGIDGAKSGLWREFARVVREVRPAFILVENVPEALSRGIDRILGDLAVLGFDAEWDVLPAGAFGAPHIRERLFLVAHSSSIGNRLSEKTIFARRTSSINSDWWASEPGICRVANGVPKRVDRLRALGNAVVPQCAEWIGHQIMEVSNGTT